MITQETAERIWECYREISAAEKLLADMEKAKKDDWFEEHGETLPDAFGRRQRLQLGVPSGKNCHHLFGIEPDLAKSVIRAHIAQKRADLAAANEQARIELQDVEVPR
jgi:hypothetical protein